MLKKIDIPPLWLAFCMGAAYALSIAAPWPAMTAPWIGAEIMIAGVAVAIWAAVHFRKARTTIIPHLEPSALITGGPFRLSRNPIYLADLLILLGWCLIFGSAASLILIPIFALVIKRRFIEGEEARLRAAFGSDFDDYCSETRRWI